MAEVSQGQSLLRHDDWAGRAIAAESKCLALESELRGEHEAYLSLYRDVRETFIEREGELEEDARLAYGAYYSLVNLVVMHEPILREYYEERDELPKEKFEQAMHELHTSLILRATPVDDQASDYDAE